MRPCLSQGIWQAEGVVKILAAFLDNGIPEGLSKNPSRDEEFMLQGPYNKQSQTSKREW